MTNTAFLLTAIVAALVSIPAHAQQRVFVSAHGLDTNPCTVAQPCRTFQQAHNIAAANGEIDVIDPAGYGPLTITKGISIQAHGFGGITQAASSAPNAAITVSVTTFDPVSLNGLLLDGAGTGFAGILIKSGQSLQILNSVIRHFSFGILNETSTNGSNLLIEDTVVSDNGEAGIYVDSPTGAGSVNATLSRSTVNNNGFGVISFAGTTWLAKSVISGNGTGVNVVAVAIVKSYGDNYINDNGTPVNPVGGLTPVTTQ
jgi:Right handed beta helix region